MKRKLLYATGLVLMALSLHSCEGLFQNCKTCELVKYDENGDEFDRGTPIELCGAELLAKEAMGTYSIGDLTAKWDCN
jgi:hypothetical protein